MSGGARHEAVRPPGEVLVVGLPAALVVGLTGVALGNLPGLRALRLDHALIPTTVDEVVRSAVVVVAAVVAVAGGMRARRWAAVTAGLHALGAALLWAAAPGPVGLARWIVLRAVAAAGLAGVLTATGGRPWPHGVRRWTAAGVALAAGLTGLAGLRGAAPAAALGGALADGVRTAAGLAVTVTAVAGAVAVGRLGDRRLAGLVALAVAAGATGAVGGDVARWWGEGRNGPTGLLAARALVALGAVAVAAVLLRGGDALRRRAGRATAP